MFLKVNPLMSFVVLQNKEPTVPGLNKFIAAARSAYEILVALGTKVDADKAEGYLATATELMEIFKVAEPETVRDESKASGEKHQ